MGGVLLAAEIGLATAGLAVLAFAAHLAVRALSWLGVHAEGSLAMLGLGVASLLWGWVEGSLTAGILGCAVFVAAALAVVSWHLRTEREHERQERALLLERIESLEAERD
jgi:hypothetical protein